MKYSLILVRHAKSSWKDPTLSDHDRPLNKRGQANLKGIASRASALLDKKRTYQLCSSSALRCQLTCEAIADALQASSTAITTEPAFYEAPPETLYQFIEQQPDSVQQLLLVGHNPGLAELCQTVCPSMPEFHYPTGFIAYFQLQGDHWRDALRNSQLLGLNCPKAT